MSRPEDEVTQVTKIVVVADLCGSTSILENLLSSESHRRWRDFLIRLKEYLSSESDRTGFTIHKFTGDGWILLFTPETNPLEIMNCLKGLCNAYAQEYRRLIKPVVSHAFDEAGVSFGMDRGTLVSVTMNGREEFIGRPINVAARLQSSIRDRDPRPNGKILMTGAVLADLRPRLGSDYKVTNVRRTLRNVTNGQDFMCKKLYLFETGTKKAPRRKSVS